MAVHAAYRRLAKLWHPDRYALAIPELQARAQRRMAAINRAYAVLGDPLARHVYDRDRRLAASPHAHTAGTRGGHPIFWATSASYEPPPPTPSTLQNPNGAGEFFGILCLLLLLCFIGWSARYGVGPAFATVGMLVGVLVLAMLAIGFFSSRSPLAKLARHWAEGEPRGAHATAGPHGHRVPPHHGARPGGATMYGATPGATAEAEDDPEARAAARFERLVDEALATIPAEFAPMMSNIVVQVRDEPSAEDLASGHVHPGHTLLGLYHGVPLTAQHGLGAMPEIITIYRKPIERVSGNRPSRIRAQVRATVLHEMAHHFGIDHDEMPAWVK